MAPAHPCVYVARPRCGGAVAQSGQHVILGRHGRGLLASLEAPAILTWLQGRPEPSESGIALTAHWLRGLWNRIQIAKARLSFSLV